MNKTVLLVAGYLVFLWVALSGALAHEEQDFLQPEIDVKIGNEFSNISDLVLHSLRAKNNEKSESLKVGDKIPCFLERLESARTGEAVLSYEKSKRMAEWEKAVAAFKKKEILTGYIRKRIKGGFEFELFGGALFAFLPTSQASDTPLKKVDSLLNVPLQVIAVRCDTTRGNLAVSRREVLNLKRNKEIAEDLKQIKEGQKISCTVKNVTSFGAFLSYNNTLDLLLHQSDMSWSRVKSPHDLLSVGDTIDVIVSKIDKETMRCSASIKLLSEDPYKNIFKQK